MLAVLSERSLSSLNCFGDGCSFRHTTYGSSDYTRPSGKFGCPLHHRRFLEWIGVPESASLLEMGPEMLLHSLSREQAIDAARQLHQDVCLMTTNLDVLDQYMLCLQGRKSWNLVWPAGLQFRWRPWGCGAPPWIQCSSLELY